MRPIEQLEGKQFGKVYRMQEIIGSGGSATVYKALDTQYDTTVAVKVFNPNFTISDIDAEARTQANLHHLNILPYRWHGVSGDYPFIAMMYASLGSISAHHKLDGMSGKSLPLADVMRYILETSKGVQYAHDEGVVHRDLKPRNLLSQPDGNNIVKVSDWGGSIRAHTEDSLTLQFPIGSIPYVAPEQIRGMSTRASDLYSLGLISFELATGTRPYNAKTWEQYYYALQSGTPRSFEEVMGLNMTVLHEAIEAPIQKAMRKKTNDRQTSIGEYAEELRIAYAQGLARVNKAETIIDVKPAAAAGKDDPADVATQTMVAPTKPYTAPALRVILPDQEMFLGNNDETEISTEPMAPPTKRLSEPVIQPTPGAVPSPESVDPKRTPEPRDVTPQGQIRALRQSRNRQRNERRRTVRRGPGQRTAADRVQSPPQVRTGQQPAVDNRVLQSGGEVRAKQPTSAGSIDEPYLSEERTNPMILLAKELLGPNFLGVEAVLQLEQKLRQQQGRYVKFLFGRFPDFPYNEEDLQYARKHGEILFLRPQRVFFEKHGIDLTPAVLKDELGVEFHFGVTPNNIHPSRRPRWNIGTNPQVQPGWALVSSELTKTDLQYHTKEELIASHLMYIRARKWDVRTKTIAESVIDMLVYHAARGTEPPYGTYSADSIGLTYEKDYSAGLGRATRKQPHAIKTDIQGGIPVCLFGYTFPNQPKSTIFTR